MYSVTAIVPRSTPFGRSVVEPAVLDITHVERVLIRACVMMKQSMRGGFVSIPRKISYVSLMVALVLMTGITSQTALAQSEPALTQVDPVLDLPEQPLAPVEPTLRSVTVRVNKSDTIRLDRPAADILVGSTEIADVIPLTDQSLYVLGRAIGTTNITVLDEERRVISVIDVAVTLDADTIQRRIREITGSTGIRVRAEGTRIVLSGNVHDAVAVERAVTVAEGLSPGGVVNALRVTSPQQVMLRVQFLEANRLALREFGVRWNARDAQIGVQPLESFGTFAASIMTRGTVPIDVAIDTLERQGVLRRLAEPNLITASGQEASFLAGGEFPVPVASRTEAGGRTVTIEFKRFGVELAFVPVVLESGVINLTIEPSVSSLDRTAAIVAEGLAIPGLSTRRASTNVELRDGQSFAIAGLLEASNETSNDQVPWLGSVPVIGALFRSSSFQKRETELVVIVTPHLVRPAAPGQSLRTPLEMATPANDPDFFIAGQSEIQNEIRKIVDGRGEFAFGHVLPPIVPTIRETSHAR